LVNPGKVVDAIKECYSIILEGILPHRGELELQNFRSIFEKKKLNIISAKLNRSIDYYERGSVVYGPFRILTPKRYSPSRMSREIRSLRLPNFFFATI